MIEMKVSFDTDGERAMEDTRHWAALALTPEEKMSVHNPDEMERLAAGLSAERAASRWIVSTDPDEHVETDRLLRRSRLPAIWSSMRRARIRSGSSGSTRSTFCLACVAASARRPRAHGRMTSSGSFRCRACPWSGPATTWSN